MISETSISFAAIAQTMDVPSSPVPGSLETHYCEFFNDTSCTQNSSNCSTREECKPHESDKRNHCFVLWHTDNTTAVMTVKLKGCFMDSKQCYDKARCVDESLRPKNDLMFCCCDGDMCNKNYSWSPLPTEVPDVNVRTQPVESESSSYIKLIIPLSVFAVILVGFAVFFVYRRKNTNFFNELPTVEPSLSCPPSPEGLDDGRHLPIVLREVRARGRFGAVWRAHLNQNEVAVKIFPVQDKQSWLSEQEIFKLPRMNHTDILQFIGVEKRGDNLQAEYWLITAYHEKVNMSFSLKF